LIAWLATFDSIKPLICMESTGAYSIPLAEYLADAGFPVSVVNPAKIKAFAQSELTRAKTDKADAKLIARYAFEKQPPLWIPPPPAIRTLQALLRRVEHLLEMQQRQRKTVWIPLIPLRSLRLKPSSTESVYVKIDMNVSR
jgi:transposase